MYEIFGTYIYYYIHCKRQLWLFAKNLRYEDDSQDVQIGRLISELTFSRFKHEIFLKDDYLGGVLDFFDKKRNIIHEIKKSNKRQELHIWQVKFYIYLLDNLGIKNVKGIINYPTLRKTLEVELNNNDKEQIKIYLEEINRVLCEKNPPSIINKPYCKRCSYYDFCYC